MVVDIEGGEFFLLLPRVRLDGGASIDSREAMNLDLVVVGRMLERVWAEEGEEPFKTILPMGGRPLSKGTMSEQALEGSSPFFADLGLAELFLLGTGMFITFTSSPNPRDSH